MDYAALQAEVTREQSLLAAWEARHHTLQLKTVHPLYRRLHLSRNLETLKGVGQDGAAVYVSFIGDPQRFPDHATYRSWSGMIPDSRQSGASECKGLKVTQAGPDLVKKFAFLDAETARQWDPQIAAIYYEQMMQRGSGSVPQVHTTPLLDRLFGLFLGKLSYRLALLLRRSDKDEARLRAAGSPARYPTVYDFYAWKVAMGLFPFLVGSAASLIAGSGFLFVAFGLGLAGLFLLDFQLSQLIRKRKEQMRFEMAFSLHRIAIICATGKSLNEAIQHLAYEDKQGGVFIQELRKIAADLNVGMTTNEALERMKQRNLDIPEVVTLVELLRSGASAGTSIADVLCNIGNVMIDKALQEMEQRGIASGVQMIIPVGGLILPAIGIAVMGPGIYLAAQYFLFR